MAPLKLYLLRAVHDRAVDSGFTPHVLVDAAAPGAKVPSRYVDNGRIVLNVHPRAVSHFEFAADSLRFSARFGGKSFLVEVPYSAVLAIYARKTAGASRFPNLRPRTRKIPARRSLRPPANRRARARPCGS